MSMQEQQVAVPILRKPLGIRLGSASVAWIKKRPVGAIGLFMVVAIIVLAIGSPVFERYDPLYQSAPERFKSPSFTHFMGTDDFGRDMWARVVAGSVISLQVAFIAISTGATFGFFIGVLSGYAGGVTDNIIQRGVEVMLALPGLLLALALIATLGSGVDKVIIALTIIFIPRTVRVMRGTVLSVKENVYVDAARSIGARPVRIMLRHIAPNVMAPFLIIFSSLLGTAILTEATLSFLGLGIPPPHPSWGRMLSGAAMQYAITAPWMVIFPGLAITWLVLGFNLFGDALRDTWDPRLRGT